MFTLFWIWPVRAPSSRPVSFWCVPIFWLFPYFLVNHHAAMSPPFPGPALESVIIWSGIWFFSNYKLWRACSCFMDAAGLHETSESETKEFITQDAGRSMNTSISRWFSDAQGEREQCDTAQMTHAARLHYSWTLSPGSPLFYRGREASLLSIPEEGAITHSAELLTATTTLGQAAKQWSDLLFLAHQARMCRIAEASCRSPLPTAISPQAPWFI